MVSTNAEYGVSFIWHVDSATHEIICADLSHSSITDAQALPELIKQTHRKIRAASPDGAYDTRYWHDALLRKKIKPLISHHGVERNIGQTDIMSVTMGLRINISSGSNDLWKKKVGYHRRSLAETAMFRFKTLLGGHLSLHDYDAQVGEAMAING